MTQQGHSEEPGGFMTESSDQPELDYETGIHRLLHELGENHPRYSEALVYEQRLIENIDESRRHGDSQSRRSERSQIIDQLNQLALSVLNTSFNELCQIRAPSSKITGPDSPFAPPFADFTFRDRRKLCNKILQSKANHIELYGPCGVGKTYLLQHLSEGREGIRDVYIDLTDHPNATDILAKVVAQLREAEPQLSTETRDFARAIGDLYAPQTGPAIKHFVFLFDSAEEEKHAELIHRLISRNGLINNSALFDFLERLGIRRDEIKLQVVIAARRPVVKVEEYHPNFHFDRMRIDRLVKDPDPTEDAIQGMLRELADYEEFDLIQPTCQDYSDQVYYLTGGHPKCAKSVLFAVADVDFLPEQGDWKEFFEKHVLPTIEGEMMGSIQDDLVPVFRVLSALRRFDQPMLASLMEHGILETPTSVQATSRRASRLRRRLVDTYLVTEPHVEHHKDEPIFEPMFTMNYAVRRALSLRMQYRSPERYQAINQAALEIFGSWLQHAQIKPDRSVVSLIEIVYHRLKALEMDPQVESTCDRIKAEVQGYLRQLLEAIDEEDWPTYLPRLRVYWEADKELQETARRATGEPECYDILLREIKQFVDANT
mgnify:CR=1 FL=1